MKQSYFVVVLAHSVHGRLRRIHVPHHTLYVVLALALFGSVSLFGMVSSYLRMVGKVANYNSLRNEVDTLRNKYQALQRQDDQNREHLASLEMMASEVTVALGLKGRLEGTNSIADEGPLVPTYTESVADYDFLKSAYFSGLHHEYAHAWQKNTTPSLWPVNGRLESQFGEREDPFSGEGEIHAGVDISASMGTPVHAAADGVVLQAGVMSGYGKMVVIDHGSGVTTRYAHLSSFGVIPGQEIRRGDVLGQSGDTGKVTSPHLHFEVRHGGIAVNPMTYLTRSMTIERVQPGLPF